MNYQRQYTLLVEQARAGRFSCGYVEKHHVVPKSLGGGDEGGNIVLLSAKAHFLAHLLLQKIHPESRAMLSAVFRMSGRKRYGARRYEDLKKKFSEAWKGNTYGRGNLGNTHTEATRRVLSAKTIGNTRAKGFSHSEPAKERIGAAQRGKEISEEHRKAVSAANKGNKHLLGHRHSEETRARMREAHARRKQKGDANVFEPR